MPIIGNLATETEKGFGWNYLSHEIMTSFQAFRGMSHDMLERCQVRELILSQTDEEQKAMMEWHHKRKAEDRISFPNKPLSLNVEKVQCTLLDVFRLAGVQPHKGSIVQLSLRLGNMFYGRHKDRFVQLPVRTTQHVWKWPVIGIYAHNHKAGHGGKMFHTTRKFNIPESVLALLKSLPLVEGFGIRGDVLAIEDTFSLLAG